MDYSALSAIELQREIDRAGPELLHALKEVERLRIICQDILETINTDIDFISSAGDREAGISKIADIAHEYFKPK